MEKPASNRSPARTTEEEQYLASLLQANYLKVLGYFLKLTQDLDQAKDLTRNDGQGDCTLRSTGGTPNSLPG